MTITQDDRLNSAEKRDQESRENNESLRADEDKYLPTAAEHINVVKKADNQEKYSDEELEIQSRAASGRAVTPSKSLSLYS